jgi:hypothetical protein
VSGEWGVGEWGVVSGGVLKFGSVGGQITGFFYYNDIILTRTTPGVTQLGQQVFFDRMTGWTE